MKNKINITFGGVKERGQISMLIKLDTIDKVKKFVNIISHYDGDADLKSGNYIIDAKSIMGIFSLDLNIPLTLLLNGDKKINEEIEKEIKNNFI